MADSGTNLGQKQPMSYSLWGKFEQGSRAGPQWLSHLTTMFRKVHQNKVLVGKVIMSSHAFLTFFFNIGKTIFIGNFIIGCETAH
jgi:hypothetical protein